MVDEVKNEKVVEEVAEEVQPEPAPEPAPVEVKPVEAPTSKKKTRAKGRPTEAKKAEPKPVAGKVEEVSKEQKMADCHRVARSRVRAGQKTREFVA